MSPRTTHTLRLVAGGLALLAALPMTGCRGDRSDKPPRQFLPGMDDQPKWKPQSETGFYADGRTMRQPVEGTVAFGVIDVVTDEDWAEPMMRKRAELLALDYARFDGTDDMGQLVETIPVEVDLNLMALGRKNFEIYCATCHGYNGEGSNPAVDPELGSMVGRRWSLAIPSFHDPRLLPGGANGQDGHIYSVARNGYNTMPAYGHALDSQEAWAVVAYIRALQAAHQGTLEDVPAELRQSLGEPPPPPEPETTEESTDDTEAQS